MKTVKVGAIFLVSVMALAGVSAGYALWFDTLYIDGSITTGSIGAQWSIEGMGDIGDDDPEVKDQYSWVEAFGDGTDTLSIYVYNAYPCITYWVDINIENTGTIPIHVQDINWINNDLLFYNEGTFTVTWDGGVTFPVQIHPGDAIYGTVEIHLNNNALQDHTYTFSGDLIYHQWNENPP